ncbi:MAG: hypothetical protein AB1510_06390 [Bacillota bacterium]
MKQIFESLFGKNSAPAKKPEYWLKIGLLGLVGIFLILAGSNSGKARPELETKPVLGDNLNSSAAQGGIKQEEKYWAERLKTVLQEVKGAGAVEVTVHLAGSTRTEYAVSATTGKRLIDEKDKSGTNRLTTEDNNNSQVVVVRDGQKEEAVVENEEAPRILGVLVVAEGAQDPEVKEEIFHAAQVALGVDAHRILVLPRQRAAVSGK